MKRFAVFVVLATALFVAGCGKNGVMGMGKSEPSLVGKWKGKMEMPAASKDDPMAGMGAAFAQMFMGDLMLEITADDKFKLTLMGMPVEGKLKRDGNKLHLTAETAMGMTVEEAKKLSKDPLKNEKMEALVSEDGSTITLTDQESKPGEPKIVFTRHKAEPEPDRKETVSAEEKKILGSYKIDEVAMKGSVKPEDEMAMMMLRSASLDLYQDNTFKMNMMFTISGDWKIEGGQVKLRMKELMGIPEGGKSTSKSDDLNLQVMSDGSLVGEKAGPEGQKLVFVKK